MHGFPPAGLEAVFVTWVGGKGLCDGQTTALQSISSPDSETNCSENICLQVIAQRLSVLICKQD